MSEVTDNGAWYTWEGFWTKEPTTGYVYHWRGSHDVEEDGLLVYFSRTRSSKDHILGRLFHFSIRVAEAKTLTFDQVSARMNLAAYYAEF